LLTLSLIGLTSNSLICVPHLEWKFPKSEIEEQQSKEPKSEREQEIDLNSHWRTARSAPPLLWSENFTRVLPTTCSSPRPAWLLQSPAVATRARAAAPRPGRDDRTS
jgi:hypothetical protein